MRCKKLTASLTAAATASQSNTNKNSKLFCVNRSLITTRAELSITRSISEDTNTLTHLRIPRVVSCFVVVACSSCVYISPPFVFLAHAQRTFCVFSSSCSSSSVAAYVSCVRFIHLSISIVSFVSSLVQVQKEVKHLSFIHTYT